MPLCPPRNLSAPKGKVEYKLPIRFDYEAKDEYDIQLFLHPAYDLIRIKTFYTKEDVQYRILKDNELLISGTIFPNQHAHIDISKFLSGIYKVVFTNHDSIMKTREFIIER